MAFHVACPITCERICYCCLGFGGGLRSAGARTGFVEEIARLEEFLRDPWSVRPAASAICAASGEEGDVAVQVAVPRIAPPPESLAGEDGIADGEEPPSLQSKRAMLQKQAAEASLAAEEYVRKMEMGAVSDGTGEDVKDLARDDASSSTIKVICRICFSGENERSEKALKMLSCRLCSKKYHKSCLKSWAEYRDLFHWSLWVCPSCRSCEICRKAGDPSKFMFCKRCDSAYHCYCQQPPHKNVSHGPYLCPKHTRCHSCASTVHGSGHSTRWFLGYNFCDACGRLFMKEKYCPVCLKVYRDSESTPMVCCDVCQRWVHCKCDGISDEKYMQFQADGNLYYKCAACRGDCYQIRDVDDAVQELWRRRDKTDRELIANLRAAAGWPSEADNYSISHSDDEEGGPIILKSDYAKTLKFSVKGLSDKSTINTTEQEKKAVQNFTTSKKSVKKKAYQMLMAPKIEERFEIMERSDEVRSLESSFADEKSKDGVLCRLSGPSNQVMTRSPERMKVKMSLNHLGSMSRGLHREATLKNSNKATDAVAKEIKSHDSSMKGGPKKPEAKSEPVKGTKLVIHLGGRTRNLASSSMSEAFDYPKEQEKAISNGSDDSSQRKVTAGERHMHEVSGGYFKCDNEKAPEHNESGLLTTPKQSRNIIKLVSDKLPVANSGDATNTCRPSAPSTTLIFRRRKTEVKPVEQSPVEVVDNESVVNEGQQRKHPRGTPTGFQTERVDFFDDPSVSSSFSEDSKPVFKLKLKNLLFESQISPVTKGEGINVVKGRRSKRKRPSSFIMKTANQKNLNHGHIHQEDTIGEAMDANWILRTLGKDAVGKRVDIHQPSDNSWHRGVVSDIVEGSETLSVNLDDGRYHTLELGKQGVRLVPQKQKRTRL